MATCSVTLEARFWEGEDLKEGASAVVLLLQKLSQRAALWLPAFLLYAVEAMCLGRPGAAPVLHGLGVRCPLFSGFLQGFDGLLAFLNSAIKKAERYRYHLGEMLLQIGQPILVDCDESNLLQILDESPEHGVGE